MIDSLDYNQLDPGIRERVRIIRSEGFHTTDSGDGTKWPEMEGALPYPMVAIVTEVGELFDRAEYLRLVLDHHPECAGYQINATYDALDKASIIIVTWPGEDRS